LWGKSHSFVASKSPFWRRLHLSGVGVGPYTYFNQGKAVAGVDFALWHMVAKAKKLKVEFSPEPTFEHILMKVS